MIITRADVLACSILEIVQVGLLEDVKVSTDIALRLVQKHLCMNYVPIYIRSIPEFTMYIFWLALCVRTISRTANMKYITTISNAQKLLRAVLADIFFMRCILINWASKVLIIENVFSHFSLKPTWLRLQWCLPRLHHNIFCSMQEVGVKLKKCF